MQKRRIPALILFLVLFLILAAHLMGRTLATPAFTFAEETRTVYLTFDDGPSTRVTGRILDTLKKEGVKATFFVVGERVAGREETLKRIAAEGHTLGVHSNSHRYETIYSSETAFLKDVELCRETIQTLTGADLRVYRFPGGGRHPAEERLLRDMGYEIVWWNAVCGDEEIRGADAAALLRETIATSKGKREVVLLLHDSAPHTATAEALPGIIAYFRENHYTFKAF